MIRAALQCALHLQKLNIFFGLLAECRSATSSFSRGERSSSSALGGFMRKSVAALSSLALLYAGLSYAHGGHNNDSQAVVWDDFQDGFTLGAPGSNAKWFYQQVGALVYNDGVPTTDRRGVHIEPPGTNPRSGRPAFTLTVGQENDPSQNPYGIPGDADHPKFLAYANHIASTGIPGFDLTPGREVA
ncbi:MAG TPA: DUF6081 family protein, partial [Polyangiaceae bacterium]